MAENSDCVFCKIARKEIKVPFIEENENFFAIRDANPRAEGHSLIIPKKHFTTLLDLPDSLGKDMLFITKKVASDLLEGKKGEGFNLIMNNLEAAGQIVKHAHIHIIPRKGNDGLKSLV